MALPTDRPIPGRYRCDLLTHRYIFTGELNAGGPLLRYLMDTRRAGIQMLNVAATLLEPSASAMSNFSQQELIVLKDQVVFMRFMEAASPLGTIQPGADRERLLVYTERFVIQGQFQTSSEKNRLIDAYEGPTGRWAVAYDVFLQPLIPTTNKAAPSTAKLILLNKTAIQFFHPARG